MVFSITYVPLQSYFVHIAKAKLGQSSTEDNEVMMKHARKYLTKRVEWEYLIKNVEIEIWDPGEPDKIIL